MKGKKMFNKNEIKNLVLLALVADSYSLGSHWVYEEDKLKDTHINWENLNAPLAIWHKGKVAGDFTHFGDQLVFLYDFLQDKSNFDENEYFNFWVEKMKTYKGYMDGASRDTLQNLQNRVTPSASTSSDLSITGRIAPLLLVSKNENEFINNVELFTKLTHNSQKAIDASVFFAKLLYLSLNGEDIEKSICSLEKDTNSHFKALIQNGLASKNKDTFQAIRDFGPACDVDEGFSGVIHLLCKYKNLKDLLTENAKAGGDTSARAMIAATIFTAKNKNTNLPTSWFNINHSL